jgi:hypothetical protein
MTETDYRSEIRELKGEIEALKAQLEGDIPKATAWLQWKCWRQRKALDTLNHKVVSQRFVLRTLEELGRGLTRDEYIEARAKQPGKLLDRIEE